MYIQRTIEKTIKRASSFFPVVLITGPRQVGKTTVFENCEQKSRNCVSLDDMEIRELAKNDPQRFLERYKTPLLIDEIQYAPQHGIHQIHWKTEHFPEQSLKLMPFQKY